MESGKLASMWAFVRRYGWLLGTFCIGLLAAGWWLCRQQPDARLLRNAYHRIQTGMTPEEVGLIAGHPATSAVPLDLDLAFKIANGPADVFQDGDDPPLTAGCVHDESRVDESGYIRVTYGGGGVVGKVLIFRMTPDETKTREWLMWLGELLGIRGQSQMPALQYLFVALQRMNVEEEQASQAELQAARQWAEDRRRNEAKVQHVEYFDGIQWERFKGTDEADHSTVRLDDIHERQPPRR